MYNSHRGMVPAPNARLTELLDGVRAEFDNQHNRTGEYEHQSRFAPSIDFVRLSARSMLVTKHDRSTCHLESGTVGFLTYKALTFQAREGAI